MIFMLKESNDEEMSYCQLRISVSICQNQRQPQDVSTSDFKDYENPL